MLQHVGPVAVGSVAKLQNISFKPSHGPLPPSKTLPSEGIEAWMSTLSPPESFCCHWLIKPCLLCFYQGVYWATKEGGKNKTETFVWSAGSCFRDQTAEKPHGVVFTMKLSLCSGKKLGKIWLKGEDGRESLRFRQRIFQSSTKVELMWHF